MFGIGSTELMVIFVVALLVLGPKSLATISKSLGKALGEFRRVSTDFQRTLNAEVAQEEHEERKKQAEKDLFEKQEQNTPTGTASATNTADMPQQATAAADTAGSQTSANIAGRPGDTVQNGNTSEMNSGTVKAETAENTAGSTTAGTTEVPAPPPGSPVAEAIAAAAAEAAGTDKTDRTVPENPVQNKAGENA